MCDVTAANRVAADWKGDVMSEGLTLGGSTAPGARAGITTAPPEVVKLLAQLLASGEESVGPQQNAEGAFLVPAVMQFAADDKGRSNASSTADKVKHKVAEALAVDHRSLVANTRKVTTADGETVHTYWIARVLRVADPTETVAAEPEQPEPSGVETVAAEPEPSEPEEITPADMA
jgi:hypothetical protein